MPYEAQQHQAPVQAAGAALVQLVTQCHTSRAGTAGAQQTVLASLPRIPNAADASRTAAAPTIALALVGQPAAAHLATIMNHETTTSAAGRATRQTAYQLACSQPAMWQKGVALCMALRQQLSVAAHTCAKHACCTAAQQDPLHSRLDSLQQLSPHLRQVHLLQSCPAQPSSQQTRLPAAAQP